MTWSGSDDAARYAETVLVGRTTYLRPVTGDDIETLARWWAEPETAVFQSGVIRPRPDQPIREMFKAWSTNESGAGVAFSAVRRSDDELLGHVSLWGAELPTRGATLGVIMGPDARGRGLGTDALGILVRYGFEEMGLNRIQLGVYSFNDRAIAAYKKLGFVEEGRRREAALHAGHWYDEVLMAILASEYATGRASGSPAAKGRD